MDITRPDRRLSESVSRRAVVGMAAAGLACGTLGRAAARGVATEATPAASPGVTTGDWSAVEALIQDAEADGGVVGVAVHGEGGELFARNGDRRFRAASTIKVPILIEAWRQVEAGALSLDTTYRLQDEDRVPGSGVLGNLHAGLDLTLADLLYLMIAVSDNTATNLVIGLLGFDAINATMRSLGMTGSVLGRPMLGRLPEAGDPENWATPSDFALAVRSIVAGEAAAPDSCRAMVETLEKQAEIRRISRFVPDEVDARWGTKPGDLPGVVNDVGFVTTERSTLCLAVYCENLADLDTAERAIGLIAREALSLTGIVPFPPGASGQA